MTYVFNEYGKLIGFVFDEGSQPLAKEIAHVFDDKGRCVGFAYK